MSARIISLEMVSTYRGDLEQHLKRERTRLKWFQRELRRNPLLVPVKLDLSGIRGQAQAISKMVMGEVARTRGGLLGPDGLPVSAGSTAAARMNPRAGLLSTTTSKTFDKNGNLQSTVRTETEQLGRGITMVSRYKGAATNAFETVHKDMRDVADLQDRINAATRNGAKDLAAARGRGDKPEQIRLLREQEARLAAVLQHQSALPFQGSAAYRQGENKAQRLADRIATLEGGQDAAATKKARADRTRDVANSITQEERRVQTALKANKLAMDQAERITVQATREAEINRLYAERKRLFEDSRDRFRAMDQSLQQEGRPDLADRAMRRTLGAQNAANQAELDGERRRTDVMRRQQAEAERARKLADRAAAAAGRGNASRAIRLEEHATRLAVQRNEADMARAKALPDLAAREAELNRLHAERRRMHTDSAARLDALAASGTGAWADPANAAKAQAAALRAREAAARAEVGGVKQESAAVRAAQAQAAAEATAARQRAYQRELQDIQHQSAARIAQINQTEARERAAAGKNVSAKQAAAERAHLARQAEYQNRARRFAAVQNRATATGDHTIATGARGRAGASMVAAERDMLRFAGASRASGHALDFHSSSLLRNAASFVKWMVPMQAVMGAVSAFTAGVAGAIQVDAQFARLRAVFRGTEEEAQRLKVGVLQLASAEGRSTEEAMDAAIRWSRLGLTRVQTLQAVRVSLMAANVAEISAAEAAEKLAAVYATYRLSVGDLDTVLGRLNAISNRYNVTNKDMLEGIVRVAAVAKQSGLALEDLEGIIGAVTGATGRPGPEIGNAMKFILTRLSDPKIAEKLRENFDFELTTPTGELKSMSLVLRELAELYPTLNNAQQAYLLNTVAGSRQANRFAQVLSEFNQAQVLTAKAAFDTGSAFAENAKIVQSLQSRVDALKSSWTALFSAMGDAGAMEWVIERMRYLQGIIDRMNQSSAEFKFPKTFAINDPRTADAIETLGGGEDKWFGTRSSFSREELEKARQRIRKSIRQWRDDLGGDNAPDALAGGVGPVAGTGFSQVQFKSVAEAEKMLERINALLDRGGDTGPQDAIGMAVSKVSSLRAQVKGLETEAAVFDRINKAVSGGHIDRTTLVKDFSAAAETLIQVNDAAVTYGDTMKKFDAALASGDNSAIASQAAALRDFFTARIPPKAAELEANKEPALREIAAQRAKLKAEELALRSKANPADPKESAERQRQLNEITRQIDAADKEAQAVARKPEAAVRRLGFTDPERQRISEFSQDLEEQAKSLSDALEKIAPDAENDPIVRTFAARREAAAATLGLIEETQRRITEFGGQVGASYAAKIAGGPTSQLYGENSVWQQYGRDAKRQQEDEQIWQVQADAAREKMAAENRRIANEERAAAIERAARDAGKRAGWRAEAFRYGESDADKNINVARAAINRSASMLGGLRDDNFFTGRNKDVMGRAEDRGAVLADEKVAREALENLERRQYEIEAARRQVAIDTAKAMRDQTEEAGKRLALASREDQLRAAALKRTIRDTGAVGANEFFMLSQQSRQVFANYLPNDAPDFLNDAKQAARRALETLNQESVAIAENVSGLRQALKALEERITRELGQGGVLEIRPEEVNPPGRGPSAASNPGTRDASPTINLNLGSVSVAVNLAKQVEPLLTNYVDRNLAAGLSALEARLTKGNRLPAVPSAVE
jgi:TP901 family phage tail tape measure protein